MPGTAEILIDVIDQDVAGDAAWQFINGKWVYASARLGTDFAEAGGDPSDADARSRSAFVVTAGGGKKMIHDFDADTDQIDLSTFGLDHSDLSGVMQDQGWATIIDLSQLAGGVAGDMLILKSVSADDLVEANFSL